MLISSIVVGDVGTNCYIVSDESTKEAVIIDPGDSANVLLRQIKDQNLKIKYILLTHGHFDHVLAVPEIKAATGAAVCAHRLEVSPPGEKKIFYKYPDPGDTKFLDEGDILPFACGDISVMNTPGHSQGSLIFRIGDDLFTGDTIFEAECGRCDLPGGDYSDMLKSLKRLHDMEGDLKIYPGHGPSSNLGSERRRNRYMREAVSV